MTKIFISYRRADSRKDAGRIYDRLVEAFGKENVFKDVDNIPLGKDFRGVLREAVAKCDVMLAIIGTHWIDIKDEQGNRRLDNPGDFVRIEIESALQRDNCLVIPVLVDNAFMPRSDDLPLELRELAFKNATIVQDDPEFHHSVTKIIRALEVHFGITSLTPLSKSPSQPPNYDVHAAIHDFYDAFDAKAWEQAREILTAIRISQKAPGVFDVDVHEQEIWEAIEAEERNKQYDLLRLMMKRGNKKRVWEALQIFWLDFPDYDPDNLAESIHPKVNISSKTGSQLVRPPKPTRLSSLDLMPGPFEWIEIPGKRYSIAKYPVTNAQYAQFIAAGGYEEKHWWTIEGWEARELGWEYNSKLNEEIPIRSPWTQPLYWRDAEWNILEHPIVGVSWYEAVAFCRWLREITGENILLPTQAQWQFAAQGEDGRIYPWGNNWDCLRCNNSIMECTSNRTTPVRHYEGKGDSPFGVVDMAGNVWEWCLTDSQSKITRTNKHGDYNPICGGSWNETDIELFRCDYSGVARAYARGRRGGFRIMIAYR